MRACWYEATGAARDVLSVGEMETPVPARGEVLVRLRVSGLNPTDIKRRSGARGAPPFPRIVPHFDGAGIIEAVGEGVAEARIDDRVWVWEGQRDVPFGTAADYVTVPQTRAVRLPDGVDFETGAALGVPAMTAHAVLAIAGDLDGATVLVTGAAGAVGNYAVQIAKRMRARVIATVSSTRKAEDALRAGADHIVDYTQEDLAERVLALTDGQGVRHMADVDVGAHMADAWRYVAECGSIAGYSSASAAEPPLPFASYMYRNISIHGVSIFGVPEPAKLAAVRFISDALEQDALWHRIDSEFPLAETAAAHERQESGEALGKVLVRLD